VLRVDATVERGELEQRIMEITVVVRGDALTRLASIAAALRAAGLQDVKILEALGLITGRVSDASQLDDLQRVDGIESVTRARTDVGIPDPGSPVQ
jgi:hypothetical protein